MMLFAAMFSMAFLGESCDENAGKEVVYANGTVSGLVKDSMGNPLGDVSVTVKGETATASTASDGTYTLADVPVKTIAIIFTKDGYQTTSVTVPASRFDSEGHGTANASMSIAIAKVTGRVLDGENGNIPMAGATVTISNAEGTTVTTAADGKYTFEKLSAQDYTVTISAPEYISATIDVTEKMFNNAEFTAVLDDATIAKSKLLPGLTRGDLEKADKWYYNEYRGGNGGEKYPRWDWSTDFMGSMNFQGNWSQHGEGTCLEIDGNEKLPANLEELESFVWGSKFITDDNKIMTVRARTFGDRDGNSTFGLMAVDLNADKAQAEHVGETFSYDGGDYKDFHFDLSAYIGKEVVLAFGLFRGEQSDKSKHLAIRRFNFTKEPMTGWDWISGTEVAGLEGWHMTEEIVRSTMANKSKEFSGITLASDPHGNDKKNGYQSWRTNNHIAHTWNFTVITKDTEPFVSEGFVMKTRGGSGYEVNTKVPEAYFYSKFNISSDNDEITFKLRNFGSNFTVFKVTAITEDMAVKHLAPKSNTAVECVEAEDGCWKYKNNQGDLGHEDQYASFVYDLSEFNGKNVVICIGVLKGEENGDENKLCIHSVTLK